jgi:hypothetical protein
MLWTNGTGTGAIVVLGADETFVSPPARVPVAPPISDQTFKVPRPAIPRKAVFLGIAASLAVLAVAVLRVEEWGAVVILDVACILGLVWLCALTGNSVAYWVSKRNQRLHVGLTGLCLERGAFRQRIAWDAITQVEIQRESNVVVKLDVYTAQGRELELQDFERLPELLNLVTAGLPPTVPIKQV